MSIKKSPLWNGAIILAALGYFVDIYDLILFSVVRVPSLRSMGFEGETLFDKGILLLNLQMLGMLVGGIFWGVLGDRKGRLSVLLGSILTYSIANLLNAFAQSIEVYAVLRFIAGFGLAGELGAGITLVAELLPKKTRGFGTTIVASVGICGALLAVWVAENFDWRVAYGIGGTLGIALLLLRISVRESGLFKTAMNSNASRGDFFALFRSRPRLVKYLSCIAIGVPIWYVIGILMTFSPEFAVELKLSGPITAARAVLFSYSGLALGDLSSGLFSQWLRSRRKVVAMYLALTFFFAMAYLNGFGVSPTVFYAICFALGFASGYWAVFVTIGAEQFGTNLRATVTTTVPNFVRGAVVPMTSLFMVLRSSIGTVASGWLVGLGALTVAAFALQSLEETFSKDLDYLEDC